MAKQRMLDKKRKQRELKQKQARGVLRPNSRIILKSRREIERMRKTGQIGHRILQMLVDTARPGVSTAELNAIAADELLRCDAIGTSKNYPDYKPGKGYPAEMCISVNEEVVHGIPSDRRLNDGDIVTFDMALIHDGYCADTATTIVIGSNPLAELLLATTRETMQLALDMMRPGRRWSEIARQMQRHAQGRGYSVVREFVGHGVGRRMHEEPKVPNFVSTEQLGTDFSLRAGMTLAVEPMLVSGKRDVDQLKDGWTVVTKDGGLACHLEHTVAVTPEGPDILTDGRPPWGL